MAVDTQDNRSVAGVFALDVNDNLYLLEACEVEHLSLKAEERFQINTNLMNISKQQGIEYKPVVTLEDMLNKEYLGIKPTIALIDRQGHRTNEIEYFAKTHNNVLMYQGTNMTTQNYRFSENNAKLLLVNAKHYQTSLIYYLYSQKKRDNNYLYFYPEITNEVIKQIACVKPDNTKKFGDSPENWSPENNAQHDFFDCLKMGYTIVDFAVNNFKKERWRFCKSPQLLRKHGISQSTVLETQTKIQQNNSSSWFDI